jgi:hypothetical protein
MATEINVWTGAEWESIRGPAGATGPEGPTVVSADPVNVAKLGTDGKILVAQADLDLRYVNVVGDTMTGPLAVTPAVAVAAPAGHIQISGQGFQPALAIQGRGDANGTGTPQVRLLRTRGTLAAPTSVQASDNLGTVAFYGWLPNGTAANPASIIAQCEATPAAGDTAAKGRINFAVSDGATTTFPLSLNSNGIVNGIVVNNGGNGIALTANTTTSSPGTPNQAWGVRSYVDCVTKGSSCLVADNTGKGTDYNYGIALLSLAKGPNNYSFYDASEADNYFKGNIGVNWLTPTANLEVNGTAKVRGTIEITGNITSSGTAHNFATASIPASAIGGNFTTISVTGGRSNFAAVNEPYAIGLRYSAATAPNYVGTSSTGAFQVSAAGGVAILSITSTGNITNTGTAHSFAAGSIPGAAIVGSVANTPATSAAAGAAGSIRWDESYLYIRTATAWKRVALAAF